MYVYIYRCVYRNIYIYIYRHTLPMARVTQKKIDLVEVTWGTRVSAQSGAAATTAGSRSSCAGEVGGAGVHSIRCSSDDGRGQKQLCRRGGGRRCPPSPLQQRRRQGAEAAVPARWGSQVSTQSIAAATTARSRISCAGEVGGPGVHPIRCSRNPHVSCLSHHHLHHRGCISCHLHGCYCIWHKFIHTHASRSKYKCC